MTSFQRLGRAAATVFGTLTIALLCYSLHAPAIIAAILLLSGVLFVGAYLELAEAVAASFAATLSLDYFFIPPIRKISIADPQGWIVLLVFLAVSLFATSLSSRIRRQRDELAARHSETEKLYALSRALLLSERPAVRRLIVNKCIELFGFQEVALYETVSGTYQRSGNISALSDEKLKHAAVCGSVSVDEAALVSVVPITLGNKTFGSLGVSGVLLPEASMQALVNTVAVSLAQTEAAEANNRANAVRQGEELKSVMIDALAHDLKTPLTVIGAATDMLVHPAEVTSEQRSELLQVVRQEAQDLRRMVDEAIHLARIDAEKLKLESTLIQPGDLVREALEALADRAASRAVTVDVSAELPPVLVDRELSVQAIKQLVDNALKYSPTHSPIAISVRETNGMVSIGVRDYGRGLTGIEQGHVFDKFYRGRQDASGIQGTGMGLAIAKEIVEAHGGTLSVESQVGQGSLFTIRLHAAGVAVPATRPA